MNPYESTEKNGRDGKGIAQMITIAVVVTLIVLVVGCGLLGVALFYLRASA
jgi:hypothetical protein